MQKLLIVIIIFSLLLTLCSCGTENYSLTTPPSLTNRADMKIMSADNLKDEVRGIWIASVYNINFPSRSDLTEEELKSELDSIIDYAVKNKMNTVFFQVHPSCDSLYRSEVFPVSKFLFSDGELKFDPLEYIIEISHNKNIKLHAWINPLRVSTSEKDTEEAAFSSLPANSPANSDNSVYYADKKIYFNAGDPEVRNLISSETEFICKNYKVDGIVFDDYFYPSPVSGADFDDKEEYSKYGQGMTLEDWRRNNINMLIKECYDKIKSVRQDCIFGVSPAGVWQNNNGENGGSDTRGFDSYSLIYCDALAWANGGYVDYISPQIYWELDNEAASFEVLTEWWDKALSNTGVELIISHAAYKYDDSWESGEISRQIAFARNYASYAGSMMYGYAALSNNSQKISDEISLMYENRIYYFTPSPSDEMIQLSDTLSGLILNKETFVIEGVSDPTCDFTINGEFVSRKRNGEFSKILTLSIGKNEYILKCGNNSVTIYIYRDK